MAKKAYIGVDGVARKIKKGYIGVENFTKRALPSGYTQLSHIEATGAQYFDTGFKPNQDTRVVMDVQMTSYAASQFVFGCRTARYTDNFIMLISSANNSFRSGYGSSLIGFSISDLTKRYSIDHNKTVCKMGEQSVTHSAQTFQSSLTMFLCAVNEGGTAKYFAKMKLPPCQIYDNGTLIHDYVPCKNASGVAGLYDAVDGVFGGSASSTPFVAGDTYKGVARKIRKAYIGIGGVARPCWSGGELAYYGTIDPLHSPVRHLAASSNGEYALFMGGDMSSGTTKNGRAYDKSLTRSSATLSNPMKLHAASGVGKYALFGGGTKSTASYMLTIVDAYDHSLTRTDAPILSLARQELSATSVGDYALFGGGYNKNVGYSDKVDAYSIDLTKSTPATLRNVTQNCGAAHVGDYALFAGGWYGSGVKTVTGYNHSLTRSEPTDLSVGRRVYGASVGDYAVFVGGHNGTAPTDIVDAYNTSLTRTTPTVLSRKAQNLAATSIGDYALFGGGYTGSADSKVVDVYDASLTRTTNSLSAARSYFAATTIDNYALFGGGYTVDGDIFDTVDAFTVA